MASLTAGEATRNDPDTIGTVEAVETKSRLTFESDAGSNGWFHLVFPLFRSTMRKQEKANMTHIHETLEHRLAAGNPPRNSR